MATIMNHHDPINDASSNGVTDVNDLRENEDEDEANETFSAVLNNLCRPPRAKLRDPHSIKTAAAAAALIETIREQKTESSEAAVFATALAAFTATCASAVSTESPQQALLEILRAVIPFVAVSNPNLFRAQFATLTRALQAVVASVPAASSVIAAKGADGNKAQAQAQQDTLIGSWNSLLRLCIRTAAAAVMAFMQQEAAASANLEKDVMLCFQGIILQHLDDTRPKVRREAQAEVTNILRVASTLESYKNHAILQQMVRYIHHTLSEPTTTPTTSVSHIQETKILHTIALTERTLLYFPQTVQFQIWQDVVQLVIYVLSMNYNTDAPSAVNLRVTHKERLSMAMMAHATLEFLGHSVNTLQISTIEQNVNQHAGDPKYMLLFKDHMTKSLASLLKFNTSIVLLSQSNKTHTHDAPTDCLVVYVRCIVSIMESLVKIIPSLPEHLAQEKDKTRTTVTQLLPLCFSSLILFLEEEGRPFPLLSLQGLCAELGRLVRTVTFLFTGGLDCVHENKHRQSIVDCITSLQKILTLHSLKNCWSMLVSALTGFLIIVTQGIVSLDVALINKTQEDAIHTVKIVILPALRMMVRLYSSLRDPHSKASMEHAMRELIHGIGIELFISIIPLTGHLDEDDLTDNMNLASKNRREKTKVDNGLISSNRAWLLKILKTSSSYSSQSIYGSHGSAYRPRLALFTTTVLSWARASDKASAIPNLTRSEAAVHRSRVIEIWSLFPCFCFSPADLEISLPPLAQILVKAMSDVRYPELVPIICSGLKLIIETSLQLDSIGRLNMDKVLESHRNVLSETSLILLPTMFKLVETLNEKVNTDSKITENGNSMDIDHDSGSDGENEMKEDSTKQSQNLQRAAVVTDAITAFSTVAPSPTVQSLFKKVLHRLLIAAQAHDNQTESLCAMLGLAQALVKANVLDEDNISLLYRSIRPLIRSEEQRSRVQKRAYQVMAEICEHYAAFITTNERLVEMTELFVDSALTLHVPARLTRLKCMMFVVKNLDNSKLKHMMIISEIMGEVLVCLKDANSKTRERAYHMLIEMARVRNDFNAYIHTIVAALGAQTSHMRSAAVMALSRVIFEFAPVDDTVQSLLPSLIQTVLVLFNDNSREVVKAVIGFTRVTIANLSREELQPLLPEVIAGLLKFNKGKGRFRSKIKIILKKLVKYYGYEIITPLVPSEDTRLITHIRKLSDRAARNKTLVQDSRSEKIFDDMMSSDEDDSDNGRTLMTGVTGLTRKTTVQTVMSLGSKKSGTETHSRPKIARTDRARVGPIIGIGTEKDGEVIDLLDSRSQIKIGYPDSHSGSDDSDADDEDLMMFDDSGKLVIREELENVQDNDAIDDAEDDKRSFVTNRLNVKKPRLSKYEDAKIIRDERRIPNKRDVKDLGSAYKSRKAGGDVKRKDQKFEPYVYVPLDGKRYSKKNRDTAIAEMATIVRSKKRKTR